MVALTHQSESTAVADWLLADGFEPVRRSTLQAAVEEMQARPCALLVADVSFPFSQLHAQSRLRSVTPTILVGGLQSDSPGKHGGQVMHLDRPIDRAILMCYVSMAILDDRPVRRSIRKPIAGFGAVVNGMPSHILDVSAEGLRLELARDRRAALPPYFTVRVPLIGVAVTVQRMWSQSPSNEGATVWYGGALSQNRASVHQAWRSFVDTVPASTATGLVLDP